MDLKYLNTFFMVVTLGSFSKAASALSCAQSTVSDQISILEKELKVKLFTRNGKQMILSADGEIVFRYTRSMLDLEKDLSHTLHHKKSQNCTLSIKTPETVNTQLMPEIVEYFQKNYPLVGLQFKNCSYFDLKSELMSGVIHLAFLIADSYEIENLDVEELCEIPLVMICSPVHPLAKLENVTFSDITDYPFILPENDCSYVLNIERALVEEKARPGCLFRYNSTQAIFQTIKNGSAVTILPRITAAAALDSQELIQLPWNHRLTSAMKLLMISKPDKMRSPELSALMMAVRNRVQI